MEWKCLWTLRLLGCSVVLATIGCVGGSSTSETGRGDSAGAVRLESFAVDLDGDRLIDTLELSVLTHPSDPGVITMLRIHLATGATDSIGGHWDPARDSYSAYRNAVPTRSVFVRQFPRSGTLIFLFGEDVGCCLQSLDIYRVTRGRLEPYYHRDEFSLIHLIDATEHLPALLIGIPALSQGTRVTDTLKAGTYVPTHVIRLDTTAALDSARSADWTRSRLGGFAGLEPRQDIEAVEQTDLWDSRTKRRLP